MGVTIRGGSSFLLLRLVWTLAVTVLITDRGAQRVVGQAESSNRHIVATIPGELVIGTLIPVHERPEAKQAQTRTCGPPREQYGIQRVEAALRTIDLINRDPKILPNITLGIEIRDTCWHSPIALEQSIEFIRNAMAATTDEINFSQLLSSPSPGESTSTPPLDSNLVATCSSLIQKSNKKLKNIVGVVGPASSQDTVQVQNLLQMFNMPQVGYSATSSELSEKNYFKYFLRVVPSDELQAQVMIDLMLAHNWTYVTVVYTEGSYGTNLMKAFRERAQENEICTATLESVPPNAEDSKFDELITALQKHKNAYVVVCMCEGRTVSRLFAALKRHNLQNDFLVVGSDGWADRFDVVEDKEAYAVGGISIRIHSAYVSDFDQYYFNLDPANNSRDPWFREFWEYRFQCQLPPVPSPTKKSISSSPKLAPNFAKSAPNQGPAAGRYPRKCTGNESLRLNYKQDTKMAFVQKAIVTMAMGLHKLQRATCGDPKLGLCPEMLPLNGSQLIQHLMNVSFNYLGERVSFDEKGDPPGTYEILNFQHLDYGEALEASGNSQNWQEHEFNWGLNLNQTGSVAPEDPMYDSYKTLNAPRDPVDSSRLRPTPPTGYWSRDKRVRYQYAHVGSWDSSKGLTLFGRFQWPKQPWRAPYTGGLLGNGSEQGKSEIQESDLSQRQGANSNKMMEELLLGQAQPVPKSVCSEQCPKGHAKQKIQTDSVKCCWICVACKPNEFLLDPYHCQACERGWWPTPDHTGCYRLPIKHMNWRGMEAMSAIHVGVTGLLATAGTSYVFIIHNNTPVVKSSSRELSYMILFAMVLCHATTFFLVAKPTIFTCSMTRILPGAGYAMLYGALVTKTNRIARILAGSKKRIMTRRPMFMSAASQLTIAWLIILVEGLIIVAFLIYEPPDLAFEYPEELRRVNMICNTSTQATLAPLVFDFFLILMCTWYAFKTRNVPQNFNEAKFIGFTMYTTLVIWAAFVVIFLSSAHKIIALCLCNSFSALFALFLLFFPRLYVILCKPEKNNRSYFTTAKNLRCHIGHSAGSSGAAAAAEAAAELRQPYTKRIFSSFGATNQAQQSASNSLDSAEMESMAAPSPQQIGATPSPPPPPFQPRTSSSCEMSLVRNLDTENRSPLARLFAMFLHRKQSRRAHNIQQRIRAIRRAENLDRQLHIRQSQVQRHVQCFDVVQAGGESLAPSFRHHRRLVSAANGAARLSPQDAQDMFELLRVLIGPRNMYQLLERLTELAQGGRVEPGARRAALALFGRLVNEALDEGAEPDAKHNDGGEQQLAPVVLCKSGSPEPVPTSQAHQDTVDRFGDGQEEAETEEEDPIKRALECIMGHQRRRHHHPCGALTSSHCDNNGDYDNDDNNNGRYQPNVSRLTFISEDDADDDTGRLSSQTTLRYKHVGGAHLGRPLLRSSSDDAGHQPPGSCAAIANANGHHTDNRRQQDVAQVGARVRASKRPKDKVEALQSIRPTGGNWTRHHGQPGTSRAENKRENEEEAASEPRGALRCGNQHLSAATNECDIIMSSQGAIKRPGGSKGQASDQSFTCKLHKVCCPRKREAVGRRQPIGKTLLLKQPLASLNWFASFPLVRTSKKQQQQQLQPFRWPNCRAQFLNLLDGLGSSSRTRKTQPIDDAIDAGFANHRSQSASCHSRHLDFAGPQPERSSSLNNTADMNAAVCPINWTTPEAKTEQTKAIVSSSTTGGSSEDSRV